MHETKMIKVYFPGWQLWTCSLMVNLLVLASPSASSLAQSDPNAANLANLQASTEKASTPSEQSPIADLEPEILSEINRVRTSPQSYAQWLEQQRQYYDGIWLKLPGEKPVRTNRGKQALEEAIAFLKQQQPLPPLASSEATDAAATSELANFANTNNIQFFSYGKKTAAGIVMDLVVDELFPDRRRRRNLLSSEAEDTGVVCKPDPRYAKVCAIAYSDSPLTREVAEVHPATPTTPATTPVTANETVAKSPSANPPVKPTVTEPKVDTTPATSVTPDQTVAKLPTVNPPADPPAEPTVTEPKVDTTSATSATPDETAVKLPGLEQAAQPTVTEPKVDTPPATAATPDETAAKSPEVETSTPAQESAVAAATPEAKDNPDHESVASLPAPPQLQAPPSNTEVDEPPASPETKAKTEEELEIAQAESEIAEIEQEQEKIAENEQESDQSAEIQADKEEATAPEESPEVAINTESEDFSEKIEEGKLEQGDRVIADDGSLYDYYPMQGKAGESLTIHLESDDFDAFVALVDSNGKTVGENDDISQEDSNSELKVTLPEDGVYNVIVNTYDENGTGSYVLKVSR